MSFTNVFYRGTKKKFDNIMILVGNEAFESAIKYFYSEETPTEEALRRWCGNHLVILLSRHKIKYKLRNHRSNERCFFVRKMESGYFAISDILIQ
jgi:hypothetical protein